MALFLSELKLILEVSKRNSEHASANGRNFQRDNSQGDGSSSSS